MTALLLFALEQGIIDGALVTRMRADRPLEPEPFIARTKGEIISASKSKYCPVPANVAVQAILKEEGRFAVVGLPCHIHGLRKAEAINTRLRERVVLHVGIFCCGHTDSFWGTRFVLHRYGVRQDDVVRLDYRGEGWPGDMGIQLRNGTEIHIPLHEYIIFHNFGFFTPTRCALCCDSTNELSDVSCGDAWLPEVTREDRVGTSVVISRSVAGQALLAQAADKGELVLRVLEGTRLKHIHGKKIGWHARARLLALTGASLPHYTAELPRFGFVFPPSTLYCIDMLLSRRSLWWLIGPLGTLMDSATKVGKKLLRR